jgi:hypothetical protein
MARYFKFRAQFFSLILICLSSVLYAQNSIIKSSSYKLSFKVKGIKDTVCYLAYYYGDNRYFKDTANVDHRGKFTFEGAGRLDNGVYLVVLPGNETFEFVVVDESPIVMETVMSDLINQMSVKGSEENAIFYRYLKYIYEKGNQIATLKANINKDSINMVKQIVAIENLVNAEREHLIQHNPQSFVAKMLKAANNISIPPNPLPADEQFEFRYYKAHYFDNIDLSDDRILRTPIFHSKLEKYFNELIVQSSDSLIIAYDTFLDRLNPDSELFKYCLSHLTKKAELSQVIGMDAVAVHLFKKYYLSGKANWVTSKSIDKIKQQVQLKEPLLIGKIIPNAYLKDSNDVYQELWKVNATYTVVFF